MKRYLFTIINQFSLIANYIIIVVFARELSLSEFGELSYVRNIAGLGIIIVWFGLERSSLFYLKTIPVSKGIKNITGFKFCISIVCILVLCGFIHSGIIKYNSSHLVVLLIGTAFAITAFDIKYLFDYTKNVHFEILTNLVKFIPLLVYITVAGINNYSFKIESYFLFWFVGIVLYVTVQYLYMHIKPSISVNSQDLQKLFKISGFVAVGVAGSYLIHYADTFMIMHFFNSESVGIYSAAYTLFVGMVMLTASLLRFFISENLNSDFSLTKTTKYVKHMFFICIIISIFVFFLSDLLIANLLGQKYVEAANILNILLLSFVLSGPGSVYGNVLIVEGKTIFYMYSMLIAAFTNIILNYYFIPRYGILAAAYTTGVSNLVAVITTFLFYRYKVVLQRI